MIWPLPIVLSLVLTLALAQLTPSHSLGLRDLYVIFSKVGAPYPYSYYFVLLLALTIVYVFKLIYYLFIP